MVTSKWKINRRDRNEARQSMLDAYPSLQKMYKADDGNTEVFYFENATAIFSHLFMNQKLLNFNISYLLKKL